MRSATLSILAALTLSASAQTFQWATRIGGFGEESPGGIFVDGQQNLFVSGSFSGSATIGTNTIIAGNTNHWSFLAKYDSQGVVQWVRTAGGTNGYSSIEAPLITGDKAGNLYLSGRFAGTVSFGTNTVSGVPYGLFVAKFDSSGSPLWVTNAVAYYSWPAAARLVVLDQGTVLVFGSVTGGMSFGNIQIVSHSIPAYTLNFYWDGFVAAVTPEGQWQTAQIVNKGGYASGISYASLQRGTNAVYAGNERVTVYFTTVDGIRTSSYYSKFFVASFGGRNWTQTHGGEDWMPTSLNYVDDGLTGLVVMNT